MPVLRCGASFPANFAGKLICAPLQVTNTYSYATPGCGAGEARNTERPLALLDFRK